MTNNQKNEIECIKYFIPDCCRSVKVTNEDISTYFDYSERGLHKEKIGTWVMSKEYQNGLNALCEGKRWRGINMQMYEDGILDGSMPYSVILGDKPQVVIDFMKKSMFQGTDSNLIDSIIKL